MEIKLKEAEAIQNPNLKRVREVKLEESINTFIELHSNLVDQFQRIVYEGV